MLSKYRLPEAFKWKDLFAGPTTSTGLPEISGDHFLMYGTPMWPSAPGDPLSQMLLQRRHQHR